MHMNRPRPAGLPRVLRWGMLLAVLLAAACLFSGCMPGPPTLTALSPEQREQAIIAMATIETEITAFHTRVQGSVSALPEGAEINYVPGDELKTKLGFGSKQLTSQDPNIAGKAHFLQGYYYEFVRNFGSAYGSYTEAQRRGSGYAAQAYYRAGVLGMRSALDVKALAGFAGTGTLYDYGVRVGGTPQEANKLARNNLRGLATKHDEPSVFDRVFSQAKPQQFRVLNREIPGALMPDGTPLPTLAGEGGLLGSSDGPAVAPRTMAKTALVMLDVLHRFGSGTDRAYYFSVKAIVDAFNALSPAWGPTLALIFLALLVKLITIPFTNSAFRGMRDMQRIQPLLKELQEKYKDDKQRFAEEQMRLMKEHNVNPMGGCLPMLIQLPIFIVVYNAVNVYAYGFWNASFIWIPSLALPDFILLLLYLASMVVSQKLSPTNSSDPAMQQQQRLMTWMMPIFLAVVLKDFASAFVLYWLFLNIFTTIHQYYLLRQYAREDAAAGIVPAGGPTSPTPRAEKSADSYLNKRKKGK